jgi:hypothetical protein
VKTKGGATTHRAWSWYISGVIIVALAIGSLLVINQSRSSPRHLLWPTSEVVTVTGFGRLSPMNPSSAPLSVVLTPSEALALNSQVEALPLTGLLNCHENSVVFTIAVAQRSGGPPNWTATDWECPAPGVLYIHLSDGIQELRGQVCTLRSLVTQILPKNAAKGTRAEFKLCS